MRHIMEDRLKAEKLFVDAEHAEEKEDFENATALLKRAAKLEHTGAQITLGNFYSWGRGVAQSSSDAAFWYRRAYRNGDESGALNLAIDRIKEGNTQSAIRWLQKAVEMHSGEALVELAKIYLSRPRGKAKAVEFLQFAKVMRPSEISEEARESAVSLLSSL